MGSERHERRIGRRTLGFAALAVIGCLVWGLPASAQASSSPVIESLSASNITQDNATVEAQVNPEGLETTFELFMPEDPCNVPMECIRVHVVLAQGSIPATAADESISIDLASKHVSMEAGEQYGFVIIAKNSAGTVEGHYSFRTLPKNTAPSEVVTGPAEPTPTGYKLEGRLNPDGLPTTYYYEYIGSDEIECLDMEPGLERCWHETAHVGPINGDTQQEVPPVEVTATGWSPATPTAPCGATKRASGSGLSPRSSLSLCLTSPNGMRRWKRRSTRRAWQPAISSTSGPSAGERANVKS